jgi:hypothetical protein
VSARLEKTSGTKWGAGFSVPEAALSAASGHSIVPMSVDKFTWAETKYFPIVTLSPGAEFRLRLPVAETIASLRSHDVNPPPGEYDVTFNTKLEVLAGDADGNWKDFAPMRLVVGTTAKGTLK